MKLILKRVLGFLGLKRLIARFIENISFFLLTHSKSYLSHKLNVDIEQFNKKTLTRDKSKYRIFTIWETDEKYRWLDYENRYDDMEFYHVPRTITQIVFKKYLNEYVQTKSRNTIVEFYKQRHQKGRESYYQFCLNLAWIFKNVYKTDLFILPKLHDDWIIEFISALKTQGIPILVNERESVNTPKRMETAPQYFRDYVKSEVDSLCCCNQTHFEFWKLAGHPVDKMCILGDIKSDYWSHPERWQSLRQVHPNLREDRVKLLFFAFGKKTYLNYYYDEIDKDIEWTELNRDFHDVIKSVLKKYKGKVQVIYKTGAKLQRDLFDGFDDFEKEIKEAYSLDDFIYLDSNYSSLDLIRNSSIVMGFQTTAIIEGLFTDKPVVTGGWGKYFDLTKDTLLPFHKCNFITFATSKEDLLNKLSVHMEQKDFLLSDDQKFSRKNYREEFFFNPDGKRTQAFIEKGRELILTSSPRRATISTDTPIT